MFYILCFKGFMFYVVFLCLVAYLYVLCFMFKVLCFMFYFLTLLCFKGFMF